ncbi:MAG: DNA replication protein DnaC, partial [Ruminococcaceae bacterium]|nr:DNA replication protein DnaC [Oscillospiraceae bacterium]NLC73604.1 DNA replication protein DnaC [Oscillospiraceae bacterium]
RLIGEKPTIISTNYSFSELEAKYNPQILSRIEGEYLSLPFRGQDIRKIKKML